MEFTQCNILAIRVSYVAMLSSCLGVNTELLPNFGLPVLPLEILSCKVPEGMLNDSDCSYCPTVSNCFNGHF
jgi:hypothetical protein